MITQKQCVEIFRLYMEQTPVYKIAKVTKTPAHMVVKLLRGSWTIPKLFIPEIKALGFKICTCCHARIVPIEPFRNVTLTQLCTVCWLNNGFIDPVYPVEIHCSIAA